MDSAMKMTFDANTLATTVGANNHSTEPVVLKPRIKIPIDAEAEYEFGQQKFKDQVSSSSSRSFSPRKCRKISSLKKVRWSSDLKTQGDNSRPIIVEGSSHNAPPTSIVVKSVARNNSSSVKELSAEGAPILTKRVCQRKRQRLAHQFVKALEQVDGLRYHADIEFRRRQATKPPPQRAIYSSTKLSTNEWVHVKRTRSTLEERIQKRCALFACTDLVQKVQELQKEEVVKEPPKFKQAWVPKAKTTPKSTKKTAKTAPRG